MERLLSSLNGTVVTRSKAREDGRPRNGEVEPLEQ
jgi:hypothetical protein